MVRAIEARGAGDLARRAFQNAGQIFRHAIVNGITENNPASKLRPSDVFKTTTTANVARVSVEELPTHAQREVYRGEAIIRRGAKLLALTFLRTSELIEAPWSEINFADRRWIIPKQRMKMPAPYFIPLSAGAIEVLELLQNLTGSNRLLFPGEQDPSKPMSNNTILFALYRMGYKGRKTGHRFRGIASTILHEQGYKHEHIE